MSYTGLNQVDRGRGEAEPARKNTTSFTYNENGAPLTTSTTSSTRRYEYDARDLVSKVTIGDSPTDPTPKMTTFTYTDRASG